MLNKLSYSVTFPTTGRTLAGEFEFKPGFGLITGANEQGKSLIIEVVRWCLFGSTALRGKLLPSAVVEGCAAVGAVASTVAGWSAVSGHLHDEGEIDLISGLGALNEGQTSIHSGFGDPAVRQPCRRN